MLFAIFLVFQVCRLDPETDKFTVTDRVVHVRAEQIDAISNIETGGTVECSRIASGQGYAVFVKGTVPEIIARITDMGERR